MTPAELTFLLYAFIAAFALLTVVAVVPPLVEKVRARYARQEFDAAEASGDLEALLRVVVDDLPVSSTPIHDELAVARFRRQLDEGTWPA